MADNRRLHSVPTAPTTAAPLHVYAVAPRNDGLWGSWCYACSNDAGTYVYPCKTLPGGDAEPPAVLAAPSKLVEMQKETAGLRDQLHTAQGALAHVADQLGLWDDDNDTLNTHDIFEALERLKEGQQ